MINVAIMGHGVVGSGVAEILHNHSKRVSDKAKADINIKYILDLRDFDGLPYSDKFIKDFNLILNDPDVQIVVEVMGGCTFAYDYVKACLLAGKSVCSSNKELVAAKGAELLDIALEKNVNFLFEASVGGGIPVLRPMAQCLTANEITEVTGILNGTTNFILTKMIDDNMSFENALKLAQELGYAEKDPTADVEGHDACRKICILASLGFGKHVYPEQVKTEGISNISLQDVEYAAGFDCVIKLIGRTRKLENGKITANVYPALISKKHMLAGVNDVFNAIMVRGDEVGDVMFYGRGAGKFPTASAVVGDVIDCAKHLTSRKYLHWIDGDKDYVSDSTQDIDRYYVLISANDLDVAVAEIETVFNNPSYIVNKERSEIALLTENDIEGTLLKQIDSLVNCKVVKKLHALD
ncbi:MAG: homoserine dehydrogenase [Acutalibacteraceae bacterium]|nr:homoserine dehydrogenase [Acutalibacteraceae bacterium]